MGKTIVIAAAALLLGIFVGGIAPRAELQRTREALAQAEAKASSATGAALPLALGLGSLAAARQRADQDADERADRSDRARAVPRFTPGREEPAEAAPTDAGARTRDLDDDRRGFAAAKTAMDLRAAQYRSAFFEEARFSAAAAAKVDATIAAMNAELARAANEIASGLTDKQARGERLAPRDFADVGARVLDIYRRADDQLKAGLDEAGRAAMAKTEFDLITQIDMAGVERLAETVKQLDEGRRAPTPGSNP